MHTLRNKLIVLAVLMVLAITGSLMNSRQAAAQGPANGLAVNIVNPLPVPVSGSTTVSGTVAATQSGPWNVGISGPISALQSGAWTVRSEPEKPSNLVTLITSKRPGIRCPEDGFAGRVSYPLDGLAVHGGGGVFNIFTIPQGQVLVITRFDWQGVGHAPSRLALVDISTQSSSGFNVSSAVSAALADSGGSAVGSESLGSGMVVRPNELVCLTLSGPGEIFGHAQGFLTADR